MTDAIHIPSYGDVFEMGHKALEQLWFGTVFVQEKIDGSQISFRAYGGTLSIRSKRKDINPLMPEGMFVEAVQALQSIAADLHPGWTYRGEYLQQCFDDQTEVLTSHGWKRFVDLEEPDLVATMNPENSHIVFQKPSRYYNYAYTGKMLHIKTKSIDCCVTPNHNLFVALRGANNHLARSAQFWKFQLVEAQETTGRFKLFKRDGIWSNGECPATVILPEVEYLQEGKYKRWPTMRTEDWLMFFGFWLAEGHTTDTYQVGITNLNHDLLNTIKEMLARYDIIANITNDTLRIINKQLHTHLSQFGKAGDKYIPVEIKCLSSDLLNILLHWYMLGDGHSREGKPIAASTVSKRLADDLQEIALKVGISANVTLRKHKPSKIGTRTITNVQDIYVVTFHHKNLPRIYTKSTTWGVNSKEEWIDYNGTVYCVEVPEYHTLYVRRNGKPHWSGNCKHNTVAYARIPAKHIILFDVDQGNQDYLPRLVHHEAERLGLECVPTFAIYNQKPSDEELAAFLDRESILGGVKVEGIALKNYTQFGPDKKILMGKLVRADFKEVHRTDWKERNPTKGDFVEALISRYATEARWRKAIEHLRDEGQLQHAPQDIPVVMKEVIADTLRECEGEIRDALFKHFWPQIARSLNRGVPEWYKDLLAGKEEKS